MLLVLIILVRVMKFLKELNFIIWVYFLMLGLFKVVVILLVLLWVCLFVLVLWFCWLFLLKLCFCSLFCKNWEIFLVVCFWMFLLVMLLLCLVIVNWILLLVGIIWNSIVWFIENWCWGFILFNMVWKKFFICCWFFIKFIILMFCLVNLFFWSIIWSV